MRNISPPQLDQTLESVVAKSFLENGIPSCYGRGRQVGDKLRRMRSFAPPNVMDVYMTHGRHWYGDAWKMLERHCYVGMLRPFVDSDVYADLLNAVLLRRKRTAHALSSSLMLRAALHFCPTCVETELDTIGFAYAHRVHQLAGVDFCDKHADRLHKRKSDGCDPFADAGVLTDLLSWSTPICTSDEADVDALLRYSKFAAAALEGTLPSMPYFNRLDRDAKWQSRLWAEPTEQRIAADRRVAVNEVVAVFGSQFLRAVGARWFLHRGLMKDVATSGNAIDSVAACGFSFLAAMFDSPHAFRKALSSPQHPYLGIVSGADCERPHAASKAPELTAA